MGDYNYGQFSADQYDLLNFAGPKPGEKCPDGEVEALDGSRHRLLISKGTFWCWRWAARRARCSKDVDRRCGIWIGTIQK